MGKWKSYLSLMIASVTILAGVPVSGEALEADVNQMITQEAGGFPEEDASAENSLMEEDILLNDPAEESREAYLDEEASESIPAEGSGDESLLTEDTLAEGGTQGGKSDAEAAGGPDINASGEKEEESALSEKNLEEILEDALTDGSSPFKAGGSSLIEAPVLTGCYNSIHGGDLYWDNVDGALGYCIYRNRAADGGNILIDIVDRDTVHYYDEEIVDDCWGRVYVYTVRALDEEFNESSASNAMTLQRLAPMKFTEYYAKSNTSAALKWECAQGSNKALGYEVQYAASKTDLYKRQGTFKRLSVSGRNNMTAVVTGLSKNTTYYFRIRSYVYYTHSLTGVTTKTWSQYSSVVAVKTTVSSGTNYRALLIGNAEYYIYSDILQGPVNDASCMSAVLKNYGYSASVKKNLTGSQMITAIRNAFSGADSNDVSLFFYSGHGDTTTGALLGTDYTYVTLQKLASMLSEVPGKVVIILDSCGSGGGVSKGISGEEDFSSDSFDPDTFNSLVIQAFAEADPGLLISENELSDDPEAPQVGYGELRTSKFLVLTASGKGQSSSDILRNGVWGGAMTRTIVDGAGCYFPGGSYRGYIPADNNNDKKLTLSEMYNYSKNTISNYSRQSVNCYPEGSTSVVMVKK